MMWGTLGESGGCRVKSRETIVSWGRMDARVKDVSIDEKEYGGEMSPLNGNGKLCRLEMIFH